MKREITPTPKPSKGLLTVYRVAVALVLLLIGVWVAGTTFACIRSPDAEPLFRLGGQGDSVTRGNAGVIRGTDFAGAGNHANMFSGIGRLRIPLEGQPPATVVLSLSFPYPADDLFFAEELASRIGDFRSIAEGYFSSLPRDELARLDETRAKNEILSRYNAMLRLGRIETLYFTDLIILD
ncbi:MAG: flagellar basal body protein FliL [Treponema sp.]|nr:flagellar basal body protein FliL [Treponema sp.]